MRIFTFLVSILSVTTVVGQVTLLEENFDTQGLPAGWERVDNDGNTPASQVSEYTEAWIYKEDPINTGNGTFSSTSYFDPVDRADRWLITPSITLGASGNFISWKGLSGDPSFPDSYKVMISTTTNDISAFTDTLLVVSNEEPTWNMHEEALEDYASETIYIAFVNTTFDGFKLYLDSVYVREQDPLNISEEKYEIAVYPNPVITEVNIASDAPVSEITLYSTIGKCVHRELFNTQKSLTIQLTQLPKGIYHIQIRRVTGEIIRRKIVKE